MSLGFCFLGLGFKMFGLESGIERTGTLYGSTFGDVNGLQKSLQSPTALNPRV